MFRTDAYRSEYRCAPAIFVIDIHAAVQLMWAERVVPDPKSGPINRHNFVPQITSFLSTGTLRSKSPVMSPMILPIISTPQTNRRAYTVRSNKEGRKYGMLNFIIEFA
jgi:hypothetical protein